MSVRVSWDNAEKTILLCELIGHWTWDEYIRGTIEIDSMLSGVPHTAYFILTLENPNYLPPNALSQIASLQRRWPANAGFMVIVGSKTFIKTIISLAGKINSHWGERFRFADTLEEARALIAVQIKP